jgi:hypothetical protein
MHPLTMCCPGVATLTLDYFSSTIFIWRRDSVSANSVGEWVMLYCKLKISKFHSLVRVVVQEFEHARVISGQEMAVRL